MKNHTDIDLFSPEQVRVTNALDRVGANAVKNLLGNVMLLISDAQSACMDIPLHCFERAVFEADAKAKRTKSPTDRYRADEVLTWLNFTIERAKAAEERSHDPAFMAEMTQKLDGLGGVGAALKSALEEITSSQSEA